MNRKSHIPPWAKGLYSRIALIGWLVVLIRPIIRTIRVLGDVDFLVTYVPQIGAFLETGPGMLASMGIGGLIIASAVLYTAHQQQPNQTHELTKIYNRTFNNQKVVLDGNLYDGCTFRNVTFRWDGDPFKVIHCKIVGARYFETHNKKIVMQMDLLKGFGFLESGFANSWQHQPNEYFDDEKA